VVKEIPGWLFDRLAANVDGDPDEIMRLIGVWEDAIGEECPPVEGKADDEPVIEYRRLVNTDKPTTARLTLRQAELLRGRNTPPRMPDEDKTCYVHPARAAELTGLTTTALAALRRRGRIRSIGMTPGEYKRARQLAGWGDASGWGSGVWYLREDVERLARETRRAA
jgi:hypothetical protein